MRTYKRYDRNISLIVISLIEFKDHNKCTITLTSELVYNYVLYEKLLNIRSKCLKFFIFSQLLSSD